jgi:hypothetical protein
MTSVPSHPSRGQKLSRPEAMLRNGAVGIDIMIQRRQR